MPNNPQPTVANRIGVVGAGQLARMMGEAAHDLGVTLTVLAASASDAAAATCDATVFGEPTDESSLERLSSLVDVVTFDHELVDPDQIAELESRGVVVRPNAHALRFAIDKAHQRTSFRAAGFPVPKFLVTRTPGDEVERFLDDVGPVVIKAARGGYDGRGVLFPATRAEVRSLIEELSPTVDVVIEERLALRGELAQIVVRGTGGECVTYPLVTTVQSDGMCVEVCFPAHVAPETDREAARLSLAIAEFTGAVGVVAIEYFLTARGLLVNEIALRPHNSGHWTIEGARTSQFTNHLRAVSGRSLESSEPVVDAAVMVNVVGSVAPGSLDDARNVPGAYVHDYGKSWRPGRKLGHVTALGDDEHAVHVTAWESARRYGTRTRET